MFCPGIFHLVNSTGVDRALRDRSFKCFQSKEIDANSNYTRNF